MWPLCDLAGNVFLPTPLTVWFLFAVGLVLPSTTPSIVINMTKESVLLRQAAIQFETVPMQEHLSNVPHLPCLVLYCSRGCAQKKTSLDAPRWYDVHIGSSVTSSFIPRVINEGGGGGDTLTAAMTRRPPPPRREQWGESLRCAHRGDASLASLSTRWGKSSDGCHHYFLLCVLI